MGHCFYDCCCNVLTIFLSVAFYCLQNIRWSTDVFGRLAGGTYGGYSPPRRRIRNPRPNHRQATRWRQRSVPYGLISRCRRRTRCRPPRLDCTFFLSSCSRKHTRWKRGRLHAHKFFSSARLSKFGQGLRSVRRPYVGLSTPTLDGFCDGHKYFLHYIDFCLHSAQWTKSRMHSHVLIVCIHIVAPMVAHMRIEILSLLVYRNQNLVY